MHHEERGPYNELSGPPVTCTRLKNAIFYSTNLLRPDALEGLSGGPTAQTSAIAFRKKVTSLNTGHARANWIAESFGS